MTRSYIRCLKKTWILTKKESKRAEKGEEGTPKHPKCKEKAGQNSDKTLSFIHASMMKQIRYWTNTQYREEQRLVSMQPTSRGLQLVTPYNCNSIAVENSKPHHSLLEMFTFTVDMVATSSW